MVSALTSPSPTNAERVPPRIVTGFDGSAASLIAATWAVSEAVSHCAVLRVVACSVVPPDVDFHGVGSRQADLLAGFVAGVRSAHPQLQVEQLSTPMDPLDVLIAEAAQADLLVIGSSESAAAKALLLGSVQRAAVRRSQCPVVIVRGERREELAASVPTARSIVVAIDESSASAAAVEWAAAESAHSGADLMVVHATKTNQGSTGPALGEDGDAEALVDRAVARCRSLTPAKVSGHLVNGSPQAVLAGLSRETDLLVVGSRGSSFTSRLFGSVAAFAVSHAACPVVVVHPRRHI